MRVTRFAPSPTGHLHLGSVYSALFAARTAAEAGGRFLVRIEDIDRTRCRPEFAADMLHDLAWLGLAWEEPVRYQSQHFADYEAALARLKAQGLVYPCFCTRTEIAAQIQASASAPHGPDGPLYPGTCRTLSASEAADRLAQGEQAAWRLNTAAATHQADPLSFREHGKGCLPCRPEQFGDVVLARKDTPTSYHLAVTVDDAIQGITTVTRGEDLLAATDIHRLLQTLLDLPEPEYRHHALLRGPDGKRFAKRDKSVSLPDLRTAGHSPAEVIAMAERLLPSH